MAPQKTDRFQIHRIFHRHIQSAVRFFFKNDDPFAASDVFRKQVDNGGIQLAESETRPIHPQTLRQNGVEIIVSDDVARNQKINRILGRSFRLGGHGIKKLRSNQPFADQQFFQLFLGKLKHKFGLFILESAGLYFIYYTKKGRLAHPFWSLFG